MVVTITLLWARATASLITHLTLPWDHRGKWCVFSIDMTAGLIKNLQNHKSLLVPRLVMQVMKKPKVLLKEQYKSCPNGILSVRK